MRLIIVIIYYINNNRQQSRCQSNNIPPVSCNPFLDKIGNSHNNIHHILNINCIASRPYRKKKLCVNEMQDKTNAFKMNMRNHQNIYTYM